MLRIRHSNATTSPQLTQTCVADTLIAIVMCRRQLLGRFLALAPAALIGVVTLNGAGSLAAAKDPPQPLNILFIAVDDLRPQLGCYGHAEMVTPSLDRLAGQGRRFQHHYAQVPTCGASRCALLTGLYPSQLGHYDNNAFATLHNEDATARLPLPALFQQHGYQTACIGKITHSPDGMQSDGKSELPFGWDEVGAPHGGWTSAWDAFFGYADGSTRIRGETPVAERADVPDDAYPDGLIANAAIAKLRELKDQPFFLAVGFYKPHLPFNAPQRYWDLYDPDQLQGPQNSEPPRGVNPAISLHRSGEMLDQYTGFSTPGVVTEPEARHLRHAYAACISYVDAQIGRLVDELDRLRLRDNTVVVVWGDHGWHLGEHGVWGKHTLHEVALRSPLIVRMPGIAQPGVAAAGLVESVDIYPTLAALCGIEPPVHLDGQSFDSLLRDPDAPGKGAVYGFWRDGRGHSIRTPRFRFTQWTKVPGYGSKPIQFELYDHKHDPNETRNIAKKQPDLVSELSAKLREVVPVLKP